MTCHSDGKGAKRLVSSRRDFLRMTAGATIAESDLTFMRADDLGLPPDQSWRLVGRKTRHPIPKDHLVGEEDVT